MPEVNYSAYLTTLHCFRFLEPRLVVMGGRHFGLPNLTGPQGVRFVLRFREHFRPAPNPTASACRIDCSRAFVSVPSVLMMLAQRRHR